MDARFAQFPKYLAERARHVELGPTRVPALLAHPDWTSQVPLVLWMHGRTVSKELDPGRYLRWIRAGIGACAIDIPGHGARFDAALQSRAGTMDLISRAVPEIDDVIEAIFGSEHGASFDRSRIAIGGMSAGGMISLRRLCDPHEFVGAAVECTTGDLGTLYAGDRSVPGVSGRPPMSDELIAPNDPIRHLSTWRPIPLLALLSETDRVIPMAGMRRFLDALGEHYEAQGSVRSLIELRTWADTGAPDEHAGFGKYGNDAKNAQTEFLVRTLRPQSPTAGVSSP